jgi:hypothetical protein
MSGARSFRRVSGGEAYDEGPVSSYLVRQILVGSKREIRHEYREVSGEQPHTGAIVARMNPIPGKIQQGSIGTLVNLHGHPQPVE